ncbi:alpha/beta hydrolase family protein [Maricaulis parjimensis]|uniref:alpha/beta hydrolase family protein n=1 Tax=Maricaulis parjimensis TaxID=144023 RepID=UPI00193978F5|nr:alpha/beta fold hydrolase [Maricaulis parjimensis]
MRSILGAISMAALSVFAPLALSAPASAQSGNLETFATLPNIWDAAVSPDGSWLATGCSPRGLREICLYNLATGEQNVIPQQGEARFTNLYFPSNDYLIFWIQTFEAVGTANGVEEYTVSRAVSFNLETSEAAVLLGRYGNVVNNDRVISSLINDPDRVAMELSLVPSGGNSTGSRIGQNRRSVETVAYSVDLDDGTVDDVLATSQGSVLHYVLDAEGEPVMEIRVNTGSGRWEVFSAARGEGRDAIFSAEYPAARPYTYGLTGDQSGLVIRFPDMGLRRLDLETGELSPFVIQDMDMSERAPIFNRFTGKLVGFGWVDDLPRQLFTDRNLEALQGQLRDILTEDSFVFRSWAQNYSKIVIEARDIGQPASFYLLDLTTGGLGLLDSEMSLADGQAVGSRRYISYPASDGLDIGAWLTTPPGWVEGDPALPLILLPHGGPQASDDGRFEWWSAYYADLGYAVLQPNFRGSTGRGWDYVTAGHGGFGTRMIDDITDGADYLREQGIALDQPYCAVGASYGGYAALMAAIRDSEDVACVVSFAGVTNPFGLLASGYNRSGVRYWEQYMGSRFSDDDYQESITPTAQTAALTMPLLVLHGDEDTTVPIDQFTGLRRAMEGRSNVRFVQMEGANHYLDRASDRETLLRESGDFLLQHLPVR